MEIRPIGTALGAEINGVELSEPLDEGALTAIHKAVIEHQVVVLRNVELSPDEHIRLGERFGEVEVHAFFPNLGAGFERVSVLDSEDGTRSSMWHTDETFLERPPLGTLLHAKVIPPVGGDTCWASMTAAYDALSPSMKRYLDGVTAEHGLSRIVEMKHRAGHASAEDVGDEVLVVGAHAGISLRPDVLASHPEVVVGLGDERAHQSVDVAADLGLDVVDDDLQQLTLPFALGTSLSLLERFPAAGGIEVQHGVLLQGATGRVAASTDTRCMRRCPV